MTKREFLTASIGAGLALAERAAFSQQGERRTSSRKAKTTKLFKSPEGYPNGIAVTTGRGGLESPRLVPRTLAPELKYPPNGNAVYVFALPEKK